MDADCARPPLAGEEGDSARLDSWKAIATYLGRGVTTVQRWEREEGLPVRRHAHAARGSVFAFRSEIDEWRRRRERPPLAAPPAVADARPAGATDAAATTPAPRRSWGLSIGLTAGLTFAVGGSLLILTSRPAGGARDFAPGTPPRAIAGAEGHERQPTLSPDGRLVAFVRREGAGAAIFVRSTAGGVSRRLPIDEPRDEARYDGFPRWSPDGRTLAFLRQVRSAVWRVRVVGAEGGASRDLLTIHSASVSWMPDASALVVLDRHAQGQPYAAYRVAVATGVRLEQLTFPPDGSFGDWQCAVAPDGRELAVVRYRTQYQADIWVVDLQSGVERRITSGMRGLDGVDWSPDGRLLVFSAIDSGGASLWQASSRPAAGDRPQRLPATEGARSPSVSRARDRTSAAVAYVRASTMARIWRWDPPLESPRALFESSAGDEQPAISPDGRQVAFVSARTGSPELWIRPAGAEPTRLTFAGQPVATPRWSPDGMRLVYTAWSGDNADIYSVRADGRTAPWRLTFEPTDEGNPSWSNDGRSVYFRSDRGGLQRIWRMSGEGGAAVAVTRGEGSQAVESADGSQVLFVRNRNAPGLWTVPVAGGSETLVQSGVWEGYWAVTRTGIVIFERPTRSMTDPLSIRIVDPRTRASRALGVVPIPSTRIPLGVSATTDAGALVWATSEAREAQLMLVPRWPTSEGRLRK